MIFESIYTEGTNGIGGTAFVLCMAGALAMGLLIACMHMYKNRYSKNFILTVTVLPVIVQTVIMLVNGSLGTGVAVMGAFSLVRFRSVPGNSREIGSIFLAMTAGLAAGMGYIGIGFLIVLVIGGITLLLTVIPYGENDGSRDLKITIPEQLDYSGVFEGILKNYTSRWVLVRVRTVNMGSLYELHYQVKLKSGIKEKEMIDEIRCRNGNLSVSFSHVASEREEL